MEQRRRIQCKSTGAEEARSEKAKNKNKLTGTSGQNYMPHDWRSLYTKPTDPKFLEVYSKSNLGSWWQCDRCSLLGRTTVHNKIKPEPLRKQQRRLADAKKWNDAVEQWEECDR
jgi:hypothetical protein